MGFPPAGRELLLLFYFLDCRVAQIADQAGRTQGAVKTRLTCNRSRLEKIWEEMRA